MQPCNDNFKLINNLTTKAKSQHCLDELQKLRAVFQEMHADKVKFDGSKSFLYFDEAFDIFLGYQEKEEDLTPRLMKSSYD